jgi:hypothetical protein
MSNWELTEKRIYRLLKHPRLDEKAIADDITMAYQEFVEELFHFLNKEENNKILIRKLNITYIEFETLKSMEESSPTENGKLKIVYLDKLMSLINMELDLLYHQMEYPKFFINVGSDWKSPFHLNPEVVNSTDIMEIVCGLFHIEKAVYRMDGKEVFFSDFAHGFEQLLNIDFGNYYKKEVTVIRRRPNKITEFLDRVKATVIQKSKDEGYDQS